MLICECVSSRIKALEASQGQGSTLLLQSLLTEIKEKESFGACLSSSSTELMVWVLRIAAAVSVIFFLWFVFVHEH